MKKRFLTAEEQKCVFDLFSSKTKLLHIKKETSDLICGVLRPTDEDDKCEDTILLYHSVIVRDKKGYYLINLDKNNKDNDIITFDSFNKTGLLKSTGIKGVNKKPSYHLIAWHKNKYSNIIFNICVHEIDSLHGNTNAIFVGDFDSHIPLQNEIVNIVEEIIFYDAREKLKNQQDIFGKPLLAEWKKRFSKEYESIVDNISSFAHDVSQKIEDIKHEISENVIQASEKPLKNIVEKGAKFMNDANKKVKKFYDKQKKKGFFLMYA